MQDSERDASPFPGGSTADSLSSGKLLVAATLAAVFLAGSAMMYRNRSQVGSSSSRKEQAPSARKMLVLHLDREGSGRSDLKDQLGIGGSVETDITTSYASPTNESESKEGKTSRSKDRRRRGKDPLKDILKSGKKLKAFDAATLPSPKPTPTKPSHVQRASIDDADELGSPASSTSVLPAERIVSLESLHTSLSRSAGKRAQRENSRASNGEAALPSAGSTSAGHSRGTSEVSQSRCQDTSVELLSPSQSHSVLSSHSSLEHHRSQPIYGRSQSPAASASGDGRRMESSRSRGRARRSGLEEAGETSEQESLSMGQAQEARLADLRLQSEHEASPTASTLSPVLAYNNSSINSSCAGSTTTATSSSITPATSPTLSQMSSLSKSTPSLAHPASNTTQDTTSPEFGELRQHQNSNMNPALSSPSPVPSNSTSGPNTKSTSKSTSDTPPSPSSPSADTSYVLTAPTSTPRAPGSGSSMKAKNGTRKASAQSGAAHSSTSNNGKAKSNQTPGPWDWDEAGVDIAAPGPSSSNASLAMLVKTVEKEKETYKKPPRLQGKANANGAFSSFSAVTATGSMTASATHPSSLHSPTSASFGSAMTTSVSANPAGSSSRGRSPPPLEEEPAEDKDKELEEPFMFPTLNPPPTNGSGAGPTRLRASFAEGGGNSTPSTPSRRTRPPSRTGSTSTPPPGSASSAAPQRGTSVNSDGNSSVLSTQTQLASLRGALEAARLREEKNKADTERYVKEVETLRWENANSRRGEAELQAQVRSLTYQLQTLYASALNAQMQQQLQQHQQATGATNGNGTGGGDAGSGNASTASTSSAPDGHSAGSSDGTPSTPQQQQQASSPTSTFTSRPSQPQAQSTLPQTPGQQPPLVPPLHLHMLSALQMNAFTSPGGALSSIPSSMVPPIPSAVAPSPFLPYSLPPHPHAPPPHPFVAQQLQHMQQYQHQSPTQTHAQPNLFSSMFIPPQIPPPSAAMMSPQQQHPPFGFGFGYPPQHTAVSNASGGGSGPSSAAGTSSVGSGSPELNGSPRLGVGKKKRIRTRNRTANGRMPAWDEASGDDGWVRPGVNEAAEREESDGVDGDGASGVPVEGGDGDEDDDAYSEGGFNELLADAILKRPGSIRVRSTPRKEELSPATTSLEKDSKDDLVDKEEVDEVMEQLTEFTFPSISDLGNVYYRSGSRAGTEENSLSSSLPSLPSSPPTTSSAPHDVVVALEIEERAYPGPVGETAEQIHVFAETKIHHSQHLEDQDAEPTTIYATSPALSQPASYPDSETTPREEDSEQILQNSSTISDHQDRGSAVQRKQQSDVPSMQ